MLLPFQGADNRLHPSTQGDALGCVLMAFQAVCLRKYHYLPNYELCIK